MKNRSRLQKLRSHSSKAGTSAADFDIYQDQEKDASSNHRAKRTSSPPNDSPKTTLEAAPNGSINSRTMASPTKPRRDGKPTSIEEPLSPNSSRNDASGATTLRRTSTIRAVPSRDAQSASSDDEGSADESPSSHIPSGNAARLKPNFTPPAAHLENSPRIEPSGVSRTLDGPKTDSRGSLGIPKRSIGNLRLSSKDSTSQLRSPSSVVNGYPTDGEQGGDVNGWDSTVGKAGLGKTGRVINRLVSDNESLKRELKIERLKADESRQSARLLEDKMERLVSDYESRLLEANVTKTLLARKERQVESLQAAVELEKQRTSDARDRERTWREEMEKTRSDSKRQVDDASTQAALMEGRYNAIASHWRDQGDEVKRSMARMGKDINILLEERRQDDDKIAVLRDLCDQQDGNIRDLLKQKEDIASKFDEYKTEQEDALRDIKTKSADREAQQEKTLEEAREALDKLKWALNVKEKIAWAE